MLLCLCLFFPCWYKRQQYRFPPHEATPITLNRAELPETQTQAGRPHDFLAADTENKVITRPQLSPFFVAKRLNLIYLHFSSSPNLLFSLRFSLPTTLNSHICLVFFFSPAKPWRQNSIRPLPFPEGETIHLPL